jgi:hypothetical protein
MPRRLPASEAANFKKDSARVTQILAEVLVEGLEAYHAAGKQPRFLSIINLISLRRPGYCDGVLCTCHF